MKRTHYHCLHTPGAASAAPGVWGMRLAALLLVRSFEDEPSVFAPRCVCFGHLSDGTERNNAPSAIQLNLFSRNRFAPVATFALMHLRLASTELSNSRMESPQCINSHLQYLFHCLRLDSPRQPALMHGAMVISNLCMATGSQRDIANGGRLSMSREQSTHISRIIR